MLDFYGVNTFLDSKGHLEANNFHGKGVFPQCHVYPQEIAGPIFRDYENHWFPLIKFNTKKAQYLRLCFRWKSHEIPTGVPLRAERWAAAWVVDGRNPKQPPGMYKTL